MNKTKVRCHGCQTRLSVTYEGKPTDIELQAQISQESGWFLGYWKQSYHQYCSNCIPAEIRQAKFSDEVPF